MRRTCAALVVTLLAVLAVAGCGHDQAQKASASQPDILLDRGDLAPLEPTSVSRLSELPAGTQYYSCSEERHSLLDKGWDFKGRDLRNTSAGWAVDSVVLSNDDADSALQVAKFREQVDLCNAKGDANLVVFGMGKDRYAYRSITPDNRVEAIRAYALVGDHRLVQVTILGLKGHGAPDQIDRLVDRAVQKAG
jgi:hypothetical protein